MKRFGRRRNDIRLLKRPSIYSGAVLPR
jgi:hypothetical protein